MVVDKAETVFLSLQQRRHLKDGMKERKTKAANRLGKKRTGEKKIV